MTTAGPGEAAPPGWYPDPWVVGGLRYWDGWQWTPNTSIPTHPSWQAPLPRPRLGPKLRSAASLVRAGIWSWFGLIQVLFFGTLGLWWGNVALNTALFHYSVTRDDPPPGAATVFVNVSFVVVYLAYLVAVPVAYGTMIELARAQRRGEPPSLRRAAGHALGPALRDVWIAVPLVIATFACLLTCVLGFVLGFVVWVPLFRLQKRNPSGPRRAWRDLSGPVITAICAAGVLIPVAAWGLGGGIGSLNARYRDDALYLQYPLSWLLVTALGLVTCLIATLTVVHWDEAGEPAA